MKEVLIATKNKGKFEEIKEIIADIFDKVYFLSELEEIEILEDRDSYVENAMKKARIIGERFGINTIADDSGLEVDILSGRPGIFSSRYGRNDEERIERLLFELKGIPFEKRKATFKAYIAYFDPSKERHYVFFGDLKGYIAFEKKGSGGFGYDPIFFLPDQKKTLAELERAEKNRISHRGKALSLLRTYLSGR